MIAGLFGFMIFNAFIQYWTNYLKSYIGQKIGMDIKLNLYKITTNLTLLTDEMIKLFIDNDFNISVSLDGPEEIHDRYRVLKNGLGTFEIIMNNLKRIYKFNSEYFKKINAKRSGSKVSKR